MQNDSKGFEYKNKSGETPFETFLRYTDEKVKSAEQLAAIFQQKQADGLSILDIGTGNGEYLKLALDGIADSSKISLNLVEPSKDLAKQLPDRFESIVPSDRITISSSNLEELETEQKFDIVLMSHLFYHIPRKLWAEQLAKALRFLRPGGFMVVVLRAKDDAYDFKMAFKPLLFDTSFKALTIDDVLEVLPGADALQITKHHAASELKIPYKEDEADTISIIEFFLNKQWDETPANIQQDALQFIADRNGTFKLQDCLAVIEKA